MDLLIATRNRHKLEEIRQIFALPGLALVAADEVPGLPEEVVEDADTFEGNALKKARELCRASGLWTLADDSGLEVAALGNAPGVYSARYAGEHGNDRRNTEKLIRTDQDRAKTVRHTTLFALLGAVLVAFLVGLAITRSISGPLGMVVELLKRLDQGDLTGEVPEAMTTRRDEIGDLARALKGLIANLQTQIEAISGASPPSLRAST